MRSLAETSRSDPPATFPSRKAVVVAGLLASAAAALLVVVSPARRSTMQPDTALIRAVSRERQSSGPQAAAGVIVQRVSIRVHHGDRPAEQNYDWQAYRDRQGKRRPKPQRSSGDSLLQARFEAAGIAHEDPLSVASFQSWHDRLRRRLDNLVTSPSGLITIKTEVPPSETGQIQTQTLTFRSADYHPVGRTIAFRDSEVVEIAELDYKELNWTEAPHDWFEEDAPMPLPHPALRTAIVAPISTAHELDRAQLDQIELSARLVLNRAGAEGSEQLALKRNSDGVVIEGLVDSAERKRQLTAALQPIPHIAVHITTPQERDQASAEAPQTAIRVLNTVSQPSPLLVLWESQRRNPADYARVSAQLLNLTLLIRQQSHALRELTQTFAEPDALNDAARADFATLRKEHEQKLHTALEQQLALLHSLTQEPTTKSEPAATSHPEPEEIDRMATQTLELCRELTAGEDQPKREALPILNDLTRQSGVMLRVVDGLLTAGK